MQLRQPNEVMFYTTMLIQELWQSVEGDLLMRYLPAREPLLSSLRWATKSGKRASRAVGYKSIITDDELRTINEMPVLLPIP